jgi:MFS family permease
MIPRLLRENGDFRRFWLGQSISLIGDQITAIALPLTAVLALDANAGQMGALTTLYLVPNLLFSLHAGAWVDRRGRRRRLMLGTDLARAALIASVPVAYALGHLTWPHLYAVAFLTGALSVVFFVAYGALFQAVVPREQYVEGNSLLHGSRAFSFLAGTGAGGALVQALKGPYALVADAGSFLWSAVFLGRMRTEEPPGTPHEPGAVLAGARWIRRNPIIRAALLGVATLNLFNFIFFALFVLYATRSLDVRPGVLGLVLGAGSIGTVGASFITSLVTRRIGIGPTFVLGCLLFPLPLVLVPAAGGARWVILGCLFTAEFFSGIGLMLLDITAGSLMGALIPTALRSRVTGAFLVVNYGVRPVGTTLGGILGSTIGLRPTLWIATVGALAGLLWLVPSPIVSLRELPDEAP